MNNNKNEQRNLIRTVKYHEKKLCIIGIQEGEENGKGVQSIFIETMSENSIPHFRNG